MGLGLGVRCQHLRHVTWYRALVAVVRRIIHGLENSLAAVYNSLCVRSLAATRTKCHELALLRSSKPAARVLCCKGSQARANKCCFPHSVEAKDLSPLSRTTWSANIGQCTKGMH